MYCVSTVYGEMPYFTFSSIFHERLNGQFSLFPLKISAVGRSKNLRGGGLESSNKRCFDFYTFLPQYRRGGGLDCEMKGSGPIITMY